MSHSMRRFLRWLAPVTILCLLLLSSVAMAAPDVVQGDKVTVMGNSEVPADTTVNGDAVTVMGNSVINGKVLGDVASVMGNLTINGEVDGDVTAVMGNIDLGPTARVHGQINVAMGQVNRAPGAAAPQVRVDNGGINISGLNFRERLPVIGNGLVFGFFQPWLAVTGWLLSLALTLLLVALFPKAVQGVATAIEQDPGKSLLVGLLTAILAVPVGLVLLITIIGPLVWIFALIAAVYFGKAAVSVLVGHRLLLALRPPEEGQTGSLAWDAVVGVSVIAVLGFVPLAGGLIKLLVVLAGLGAVVFSNFGSNRPWFRRAA